MGTNKFWHEQEKKILREMHKAGRTPRDVAKVLKGRTIAAILNQAHALDLSFIKTESPEIDFAAFERMMKGGKQRCL